jgi:deoxyribonuclease (pyrimidine dimer)
MTRINTIDPMDLLDQHLFAEWRELPRIFALARYWADTGKRGKIPEDYRLGAGHVRFFYDKLQWLEFRHAILTSELLARGYKLGNYDDLIEYRTWHKAEYPDLWNGWEPDAEAHRINLERLQDKLDAKPDFYTHKKGPAGYKHYEYRWMWWYRVPGHPKEFTQQHAKDINA